ncbi:MAG: hypothetical protein ACO3MF_04365 [Acholeplasmataceae bacterium]
MMTLFHALSLGLMMSLHPYNMFDLSHIHVNGTENYAYTHEPFDVTEGILYTLVFDPDIIGQYYDYMDLEMLELEGAVFDAYPFMFESNEDVFYVSFKSVDALLDILYMPWNPHGDFEIIMYEGGIDDFKGFTVYQDAKWMSYAYVTSSIDTVEMSDDWILFHDREDLLVYQYQGHEIYMNLFPVYVDLEPLSLEGPDEMYTYTNQTPYTHDDIISFYTSNGDLMIEYDAYEGTTEPGRYQVIIKATNTKGEVLRKYLHITVIEVSHPVIRLNEHFIEKSVFDVMSDADIIAYIEDYLTELNIDGDVYIKKNNYAPSIYDETYLVSYEVITETDTFEGVLNIHQASPVKEESLALYTWMLAGTLSIGLSVLWIYKKKKTK